MAPDGPSRFGLADTGQMMILSAVILLIAFVALAGMVARVSQLASQTTVESERVILSDVAPLAAALDQSICRLKDSSTATRTIATVAVTSGTTVTKTGSFTAADLGMLVTGSGIQSGTRIWGVAADGNSATLSQTATVTPIPTMTLTPCLATGTTTDLNLAATGTTPRLEDAIREALDQIVALEAQHGFFVEYRFECRIAATPATGRAVVSLTDGSVWLEFRSTVPFTLAACP